MHRFDMKVTTLFFFFVIFDESLRNFITLGHDAFNCAYTHTHTRVYHYVHYCIATIFSEKQVFVL